MDILIASKIAQKLRNELVSLYNDNVLEGYCLEASRELFRRLKQVGIEPELIQGTVDIDIPVFTDDGDEVFNPLHYWIEIGDYLIDITCSQFRQYMEDNHAIECMEDVLVEKIIDANYHTSIRAWHPDFN